MKFVRTHLATIIAGIAVLAVLIGVFVASGVLAGQGGASNGLTVVVHDGDGNEHSAPLHENATLDISSSLGHNVVTIENGAARMTEADCPHGSCTQQQPISKPGQQIICLPHQLWLEIVAQGSAGGELDTNAVSYSNDEDGSAHDGNASANADSVTDVDLIAR